MFRKLLVFLAGVSLTFLLFMTAFSTTVVLTFTPAHVKGWLRDSNVYSTIVDDILSQSKESLALSSGGDQDIVNQPAIQEAAKKAFSPEFLQDSVEKIIDGVTLWLDGKTSTPSFSVDLASVKTAFASNIAAHARTRYASLPVCTAGQKPDTSDILSVECQVPGVSIDSEVQKAVDELTTSKDFLPDATITAANLTTGEEGNKKSLFEQLDQVPKVYRWTQMAPFILGALALLAAAIVIFLSTSKRKGVRRAGVSLAFAGGVFLAMLWLTAFGIRKVESEITESASKNEGLQSTGIALLKEIQHTINGSMLAFGIGFLVVALGLFIYLMATKDNKPKVGDKPDSDEDKKTDKHSVDSIDSPKMPEADKPEPTKPSPPKPKPPKLVQ